MPTVENDVWKQKKLLLHVPILRNYRQDGWRNGGDIGAAAWRLLLSAPTGVAYLSYCSSYSYSIQQGAIGAHQFSQHQAVLFINHCDFAFFLKMTWPVSFRWTLLLLASAALAMGAATNETSIEHLSLESLDEKLQVLAHLSS